MRRETQWTSKLILLAGFALSTQVPTGMAQGMPSQEQMMKVGECMANLDQSAMEAMQKKGEAFHEDLNKLCKAGQRDAALQRARQFGLEMANDSVMKQIKACTAGLVMPQQRYELPEEKLTTQDICSQ